MKAHFSIKALTRGNGRTGIQTDLPCTGAHLDREMKHLFLKGNIPRSQTLESYEVFVCLQLDETCKELVKIGKAHCPCIASKKNDCQHICALLLNAKRIVETKKLSCTETSSKWRAPSLSGNVPDDVNKRLRDIVFIKEKYDDGSEPPAKRKRVKGARRSEVFDKKIVVRNYGAGHSRKLFQSAMSMIAYGRKRMEKEKQEKAQTRRELELEKREQAQALR